MKKWGYVVVLLAMGAAACWKTKANPRYCEESGACDGGVDVHGDGSVDLSTHCAQDSDCSAAVPRCDTDSGKCGACTSNDSCAGRGATPACVTTAGGPLAGQCVGCVKESDCATAGQACVANACITCAHNSDCASGICDSGKCIDDGIVLHVAHSTASVTCSDAGPGAAETPFCDAQKLISTLAAASKTYIKVAASSDAYAAIALPPGVGLSLYIVGPGLKASIAGAGAQFATPGSPALSVAPSATVSQTLVADGLELIGSTASGLKAGALCSASVGTASLTARSCYVHGSGGLGIDSTSCTVNLYQSIVSANHGALLASGGTYDIENNFIVGNVAPASGPPISLGGATSGMFAFNTVVGNTTNATYVSGIDCGSGGSKEIYGSIVLGNTPSTAAQFTVPSCNLIHVVDGTGQMPTFAMTNATDYHLSKVMGDNLCCVDAIRAGDGGPTPSVFIDIDGDKRPLGAGWDIGADEAE